VRPALGLDRPELDHELQKLQLCVKNVYITRHWFSHGFSILLQECQDAIENLLELCRLMQRLLAEPALDRDFETCIVQLQACSAAVDNVQSEVSERGAASFGLHMKHVAVVVLLRSFERLCVVAERDSRLVNPESESFNEDTRCMSYVDATAVVKDMKTPHFKMSSAQYPFCDVVETGRHMLFHGTEPGAALALLFCAGAVVRLIQLLGPSALSPATETAKELLFVLSLVSFCNEESLLNNIAQSQSKQPLHHVVGDISQMLCLLSDSANFRLHCIMSKFDSKKMLKMFISEFSDVKKAGKLVLPAPSTPENTLKRCSMLSAGIVMSSMSLHLALEACSVVNANVTAGLLSLTGKRSPEQIDLFFSGREEEMSRVSEAIEAVLLNARRASAPAHVAVLGVPGMGKSLLVSQALLQTQKTHASQMNEVYIMKLRGRGASSVEEDLVVHARSLGSKIEVAADSPPSYALLKLKSYLSRLRFVAFIDDANCNGLQAAQQWIPASSEPHAFLVTSQQPAEELAPLETALGAFEKITLFGFDEATSLQMIKSICKRCVCIVNRSDQLKVVVGQLNCLPLGVRLFGDWCNARYHRDVKTMNTDKKVFMEQARCAKAADGFPFEENDIHAAEAKFRIRTGGVCDEPSIAQRMLDDWLTNTDTASEQLMGSNDKSPRGLVGTVRLALHELGRLDACDERACRQLLSILALCPSSSTPWALFLGHRDDSIDGIEVFTNRNGLERCAAVLQRSGLVQLHDDTFSMHQLLQQAVKRDVANGVDAAAKLIDRRVGVKDLSAAKTYREMLPAAYHVVKEVLKISAARSEWCKNIANRIAYLMAWLGGGALEVAIIQVQNNRVTTELPHGFFGNDPVIFSGNLPNGINPGSLYFVFSGNVDDTSFQITSVAGGSTTIEFNDTSSLFYCAPKKKVVHANMDTEILSDFGELDQFVIDGDGLVAHILSDPSLDWKLGGQFLHAVYLAEVLIGKLLERNAVFTVVFFTESRHVWSHPSHRLLRELLRTVLKKNAHVRTTMMEEHRFNRALVDQYRTACTTFLERCGRYHKLLSVVEKTLKDILERSLKDLSLAEDAISLQHQSQSAASALSYQFADSIVNAQNTCALHFESVTRCSRKCADDYERAMGAVKELTACMNTATNLNDTADNLESSQMTGRVFVVRDDIPSCNSAQWLDFLGCACPRFVLTTDGRTGGAFTFGPGGEDQVGTFQHWATSYFLRQQTHILASGLSFVFFDGLKICEHSVVGTIILSLGCVARSLETASVSFELSAQELRELHRGCILEDQDIDQWLSQKTTDASLTHLQKCRQASSSFTCDLLRKICQGSVQLNQLVGRVKTVIRNNRQSYMGCFRVLSELAGKYAQPYPVGSSDEDENRVPSIAECFDPNFDEEQDSEDENDASGKESDRSAKDSPKTKLAKTPQTIKMLQEALLLLARTQFNDIDARSLEAQSKAELSDINLRIEQMDRSILNRRSPTARVVGVAAATPSPSSIPASTPKVDPKDPRMIAAMALSRPAAPQAVQLSPQEKVEKCQKQVGSKEKSLVKARDEGGDVTKAQKNLDDAKADLVKAESNLEKHTQQIGAKSNAADAQLHKDMDELQKLREALPGVLSKYESAQSAMLASQENCKRAEKVARFVSFWSSCFSFRPSEYVVEFEMDGKTVVAPDKAYTQFEDIRIQIQQDCTKSVIVQTGFEKALQRIPSEVDWLSDKIAELQMQLKLTQDTKVAQKIAVYERELDALQQESIWSQWVFEYYSLQKRAKQGAQGSCSMQNITPLSDSQSLAKLFCDQFTEHWATWLSICSQLYSGFEEFKSCFSSVSLDVVSTENLCGAMIADFSCFNVNSSLLSLAWQQLELCMAPFSGVKSTLPACFSYKTLAVCFSFKSDIASCICSKPHVWPRIISATSTTDLKAILCIPSHESWQQRLQSLLDHADTPSVQDVNNILQNRSSHSTWQLTFAAAVGRAAKALCGTFANFSKFSVSKWYGIVESSAKAAILAVCIGNKLPLTLRSINFTFPSEISAEVDHHLLFLNMVFAELVKGFPDRATSMWNLCTAPLIDAFDGRLCAFIMAVGALSFEFLQDFPEVADDVASAWQIACKESRFEWQAPISDKPFQPRDVDDATVFSFDGGLFPLRSVPAFAEILGEQKCAEDFELSVFSSQIPVFNRASRNYFSEKGQAILQAMGLDCDKFKRLNYSDAILELAQKSDTALEYVAGIFNFDNDEQGCQEKEKLKQLIRNPPQTDEERHTESFHVPKLKQQVAPRASCPLGVLPDMHLNVSQFLKMKAGERGSYFGSESLLIPTVVNKRALYHTFSLSSAYDFVKEYGDWKLLRERFENGDIPTSDFNSQCEARMQPVKVGEGQVRDMCKQFPQLAIEMMLYRAKKLGLSTVVTVATAQHPIEKFNNSVACVYSLICSVISMFGPNNVAEWEDVSGIFLYYPEVPSGTKSTRSLCDILGKYAERKGLDMKALKKYCSTMIDKLFRWRGVFETKGMLKVIGGSGSQNPNHFDKVMREFRLFVGKTFYTYGFANDFKRLNSQPGDLLWDPMIDWKMQQQGWDFWKGFDRQVTPSAVVCQLRHMGHMLTRSDGEEPDPRITGWIPHRWQSEVLDTVEGSLDGKVCKNGSVLVCAPTSAGKTIIALQVMRKVCRSQNQRVIYVAPSGHLCHEVRARLNIDFPNEVGTFSSSVLELFQGRWEPMISTNMVEARTDIMGAPGTNGKSTKILVLEPHCLEQLLLSSDPDVLAWREQLVYVIFDEVHCLSTNPVWERVLAMVSCPFIALSATIGNPQHFLSWLQTVQNEAKTGRKVRLIEHKTRYIDLRHHLYLPPPNLPDKFVIVNLAKLHVKSNCDHTSDLSGDILKHIHPLCHLTQSSFDAGQVPTSLRQEPRDCMQLFDTMSDEINSALQGAKQKNDVSDIAVLELAASAMKDLHPDQYFGFVLSINRWSVASYEHALNSLLISWGQNPVLKAVAAKALMKIGNMWLSPSEETANLPEVTCQKNISGDLESISKHVLNLLCSLHQQDRLPALVFNFDINMVEALAISTAQALEEAEAKYNHLNSKTLTVNRRLVERRDAVIANRREQERVTTDTADTPRKAIRNLQIEATIFADFAQDIDAEGHLDRFTFMRAGGGDDEEVESAKKEIGGMSENTKDMLLRCLHRGIGIHHNGLPDKYLHICERLFRMGFLRVVFSTGAVDFGINMRCRTVVFAGDSIFLNSVLFQRMTGRSGRRGLDALGHVVFCALPLHRLHGLVISGVPQMNGKHPELPVLVPKALKYCQGLRYSRESTELCQRLVFHPLLRFNSNKSTFLWHMIACGHYMYHAGYVEQTQEGDRLTASGQVLAFAHSMAPGNFAFVNLYESDLLHDMCSDSALNISQKCRALLLVMVAVFKPLTLDPTYLKSRTTSLGQKEGQIVLANLNEPQTDSSLLSIYPYLQRISDQLQAFERTSLDVLQSHASAAADRESHRLKFTGPSSAVDKDFSTPLTESVYKRGKRLAVKAVRDGLIDKLSAQQQPFKCSSPFVATSGHGDSFATVAQCVPFRILPSTLPVFILLEQVQRERSA